jgi:hypothetical protein
MEDFCDAGAAGAADGIRGLLDVNCRTVNGKTLGENIAGRRF